MAFVRYNSIYVFFFVYFTIENFPLEMGAKEFGNGFAMFWPPPSPKPIQILTNIASMSGARDFRCDKTKCEIIYADVLLYKRLFYRP